MSFLKLILKNPFRSKSRALITIIGIAVGIAIIVVLGAVTDGTIESADNILHTGGFDFVITGKSDSNHVSSQVMNFGTIDLNQSYLDKVRNVSGVNRAVPLYLSTIPVSDTSVLIIMGMDPENQDMAKLTITEGRMYKKDTHEMVIGKVLANDQNITVNDILICNGEEFKIVGIFETGNPLEDEVRFTSLENVQDLMNVGDNINMIYIKVDNDYAVDSVKSNIESLYGDNLTILSSLSDIKMADTILTILHSTNIAISILAIVLGGIEIMNTLLISVMERTREIGVLKAVGWSNARILVMIIGESVFITTIAGIIGIICGVIGLELFISIGMLSWVSSVYTVTTIVNAFFIAIVMGVVGGIYPAYQAIKLPPTEALMYE